MEDLIADFIGKMGLAVPLAILLAVRAGQMFHQMNSTAALLLCGSDEPQTGMGGLGNKELPLYSPFSYNGYRAVPEKRESQGAA